MQRVWILAHSCAQYYATTEQRQQTPSLNIAANSAIWTKALPSYTWCLLRNSDSCLDQRSTEVNTNVEK